MKTLEYFRSRSDIDPDTGCWVWRGAIDKDGYCKVWDGNGKNVRGHRLAYTLAFGAIPEGLVIDHLCRVRHCVNPEHMEPVTIAENTRRGRVPEWNAARRAATHCDRGHEFDEENTRWHDGKRNCRACNNMQRRLRYAEARDRAAA